MIWLTQQTFDRLNAELEHLRGPARAEVIERISAARDEGDLKENGAYHAAKDEQGKMEGRIRQLEEMLGQVTTSPSPDDQTVSAGKLVTYRFAGDDEEKFLLGAREIAEDHIDVEVYSPQSPARVPHWWAPRPARPSTSSSPTARSPRSRSSARCRTPAERGRPVPAQPGLDDRSERRRPGVAHSNTW